MVWSFFVDVHFAAKVFYRMPKIKTLTMTAGAIRARIRRGKEKEEHQYNATLKEFVRCKYGSILTEFDPFFNQLKAKYPKGRVYTNTKEFRLWREKEIKNTLKTEQQRQDEQQQDDQQQPQIHDEHVNDQEQQDHSEQQQQQQLQDHEQQDHDGHVSEQEQQQQLQL